MKLLLINSNRFKNPKPVIPFGLCYVAAASEKAGHTAKVLDLCFSEDCAHDIRASIDSFRPDVIGIAVRNIDNSVGYNTRFLLDEVGQEVIQPVKKIFSGPIVIGGPAVGINGAEALAYFDLEYAIRGDGETVMVEFLDRLEQNLPVTGIGGLTVRRGGEIVQDHLPARFADINSFPFPEPQKYLNLKPYLAVGSVLQIQTKRGCPLSCVYCTYTLIEGKESRLRNADLVVQEIEELVEATGVNHIEFTDSVFNVPLRHTKDILRAIIAKGMKLKLRAMGLNPVSVDAELVDLMKESGFEDIDLGVESGCDITLKSLGKNFKKKHVEAAGKLLRAKNIPVSWFLLLGSPEESRETLRETFDTIGRAASGWDLIIIAVGMRVYKDSPISNRLLRENRIETKDNFLSPVHVQPEKLDIESIKLLTKRESFKRPNFLMFDEDGFLTMTALRAGYLTMKYLAPGQPYWKMYIFIRKIHGLLGITLFKRLAFEFRHRKALREIDGAGRGREQSPGSTPPAKAEAGRGWAPGGGSEAGAGGGAGSLSPSAASPQTGEITRLP